MEYLPSEETLTLWLMHYGSLSLFGLLALGIIALPIPEETLMVLAGILIGNDKLAMTPTIIAAWAGCMSGVTVSYLLGRTLGKYVLVKYGRWVGITEARLAYAHSWFEAYGKWTLFFGYFIPGIRHFTGLTAGMAGLEYPHFAPYAYGGILVWSSTFLSLGYFFRGCWGSFCDFLEPMDVIISLAVVVVAFFAIRWWVKRMKKS